MKKWGLVLTLSALLMSVVLITISPVKAQSFRSANECIQALSPRCMKLMDPQAKRSCFQGNKVYCSRFDRKLGIKPEDRPFSDSIPRDTYTLEAVTPRDVRDVHPDGWRK